MLAVKGIYDGKVVLPMEPVPVPPNASVVVVFTEEQQPTCPPRSVVDSFGCLKDSKAFAGDAVQIQREMRDEWDD
ncbi:MAG: DUF2281 domain-containing protein [Armatimonadetes bacterium]|nr:DUF2281 domain-containing protein [Armatimonadota bacterium]